MYDAEAIKDFKGHFEHAVRQSAEAGMTEYEAIAAVTSAVSEVYATIRREAIAKAFGGQS